MVMNTPSSTRPQGSFCVRMPSVTSAMIVALGESSLVTAVPFISCTRPPMPGSTRKAISFVAGSTRYLPGSTPCVATFTRYTDHDLAIMLQHLAGAGDGPEVLAWCRGLERHARMRLGNDGGVGVVEQRQRPADRQRRGDRPHHDGDLLPPRRGADEEPGLEVLARGAGIARRHRDHAGDGQRAHAIIHPGPAEQQEDRGGADQRGDGHARDRVGTRRRSRR